MLVGNRETKTGSELSGKRVDDVDDDCLLPCLLKQIMLESKSGEEKDEENCREKERESQGESQRVFTGHFLLATLLEAHSTKSSKVDCLLTKHNLASVSKLYLRSEDIIDFDFNIRF